MHELLYPAPIKENLPLTVFFAPATIAAAILGKVFPEVFSSNLLSIPPPIKEEKLEATLLRLFKLSVTLGSSILPLKDAP